MLRGLSSKPMPAHTPTCCRTAAHVPSTPAPPLASISRRSRVAPFSRTGTSCNSTWCHCTRHTTYTYPFFTHTHTHTRPPAIPRCPLFPHRNFVFFYVVLLHVVVFATLNYVTHSRVVTLATHEAGVMSVPSGLPASEPDPY